MRKITREIDIPESFFVGFIHVVRGNVDTQKLASKPEDLSKINGKEIFILKAECDPNKFRSYEKFLIELDIPDIAASTGLLTQSRDINSKLKQLSAQEDDYIFHFLNRVEVIRLFDQLQEKYLKQLLDKYNTKTNQPQNKSIPSSLESHLSHHFESTTNLKEDWKADIRDKIVNFNRTRDRHLSRRFSLYLKDLILSGDTVLDLELSQGRSQQLIAFDAHVAAIQETGYVFESAQLMKIRKRLGLKDTSEILDYFSSLIKRPVIVSASFHVKYHGNQSGYYELYFRHPDSDQLEKDHIISALIPKSEVAPDFTPIYSITEQQPFEATIVGTIASGMESLVSDQYVISIIPVAICA